MVKRFILPMMVLLSIFGAKAQMDMELPLDEKVIHGKLENGLTYYILHNEEPKNRANFYIAQRVGSSLETQEQLGLAHFLEHMAFNGTSHYPGSSMLDYLQGKGIRFGADINAYTGFDETVYNINNVPTTDQALMDSVLLVLHDWSGSILLTEEEIDKERGVIEGEYNSRNGADFRFYTAMLPQLYEEYQYQQMPIGKLEIIRNFPPQVIKDYYKKWYRPDLQGIVIVGDFDAKEMEQKVIDLFSTIPMPENAAERVYPTISDNKEPIYFSYEDPELRTPMISTYFKFERVPFEYRNTIGAYLQDNIISGMVSNMINDRLNEYSQKADCPYSYAGINIGTYLVSKQKGSVDVVIVPKDNFVDAYRAAMGIIARACSTGFMGTEVERARDQLLASMESLYKEKDKTNSDKLGRELIRNFIDNEPMPGIETEYEFLSQTLPMIPEAVFNAYASQLLHIENSAIVVSQPNTSGLDLPAEQEMLQALGDVINADYEPYVDETINEPLISNLPEPGKVVSETDGSFGSKVLKLSNGVKVVVKPTDYSNDEVLIQIFKPGGTSTYPSSEAANVNGMELVGAVSKIGPFSQNNLQKYLAGKQVGLSYNVGGNTNYFQGASTAKDINTLFELLYAYFTDVNPDEEVYESTMNRIKTIYANQESNPEFIFDLKRKQIMYPESPVLWPITIQTLNEMDYAKMLELYKESVKNAADYTIVIVGNVDIEALKPMLEQYVATLPSAGVASPAPEKTISLLPIAGKKTDSFEIPSQTPVAYVYSNIHQTQMPYTMENDVNIGLLGDVLDIIYLETLREEMGATYSPNASAGLNPFTSSWSATWYVVTNEEQQQAVVDRANEEFKKLMANGTDMTHFAKVREQAVKQLEIQENTNSYWKDVLVSDQFGFDEETGRKAYLENLTLEDFNKFVTNLYNGENQIEILGVAK